MLYQFRHDKVLTNALEYSVAYHCNLRCSGCSHMSPFIGRKFPSIESFSSDINKLSKALHAVDIRLVGGEPLLHPEINTFIKVAKASGIADNVMVTTNGLLLHKMNDEFWENVDFVSVTLYKGLQPEEALIELFKDRAKASNTRLRLFPNPIFRTTIATEAHPKDWITDIIFRTCKSAHLYHCHMIHEGKLYKCAVPPFLPEYLSKMGVNSYDPTKDAFDIHGTPDIFPELKEYLMSFQTMEACRFCFGYTGKFQQQHQLKSEHISSPSLQNISRKTHLDYYKFLKETLRYYRRRTFEKVSRKPMW